MKTAEAYPRVAFLTPCAFNAQTGTGITFANLFRDWPKDRLATVTDDPIPVAQDTCDQYYYLSTAEIQYLRPFSMLLPTTIRLRQRAVQEAPSAAKKPASLWPLRFVKQSVLGSAGLPDRGCVSDRLRAWLRAFQPDLIFSILGSPAYFDLLDSLHRDLRLPFVLHVMDHGTIDPQRPGLFGPYLRWRCRRGMANLVPRAARCLAIGEAMADEYTQRYGRPFQHFQNTIDLARWPARASFKARQGSPVRLVYTGSLLPYAGLESLKDCAQAVTDLRREGMAVELHIYAPLRLFAAEAAQLPQQAGIVLHDVPQDDDTYFATLAQADVLLLPVNFDPASFHYIRLSMPTKVPSYLASGVPILVYGPAGLAQVDYARKYGWGQVVPRRSPAALKQGLCALLQDAGLRSALSERALATARRFHDSATVRNAFQQVLMEAARKSSIRVATAA